MIGPEGWRSRVQQLEREVAELRAMIGLRPQAVPATGLRLAKGKLTETLAPGDEAEFEFEGWDGTDNVPSGATAQLHDTLFAAGGETDDDVLAVQIPGRGGRWELLQAPGGGRMLLGKTDSTHAKGASGTVSVWTGTPGSETDSGDNVTAWNKFADLEAGVWVLVAWANEAWYLVAAECEPEE